MYWQVQEAKQRFSEVLRAAETGEPQIVTKHGEEVAVVIDIAAYRRLKGEQVGLMEYLRVDPLDDVDLDARSAGRVNRPATLTWLAERGISARHECGLRVAQERAGSTRRRMAGGQLPRRRYLSAMVVGEIRRGVERLRPRDPKQAEILERWLTGLTSSYRDRLLPSRQRSRRNGGG